ncbi:MAG: LytR cell envelope-related transcriptional attenuator [Acidimicrobiales bacterium]|nr:LytR cell envelope-related transcriptional attenuator [Acidimicrobiales bacterium]
MTAPRHRARPDPSARGLVLLAAVVLVGFVLLLKAGGGSVGPTSSARSSGPTTTTLTTTPDVTTTTSGSSNTTVPGTLHKTAKVLVLNATGSVPGLATKTSTKLKAKGFNASPAPDPKAPVATSAVYYLPGYQADAAAVAAAGGFSPSVVAPLPAGFPSSAAVTARAGKVVVLLGKDAPTT